MKKSISIIVPVYNSDKYLKRCIDSIFDQSFKDFELILVDDGSTDNSLKICEEYSTKYDNVRLIKSKHVGAGACRNIGLNNSNNEFITFIDSDDFIDPLYLEALYNTSIVNNYDLCFCNYKITKRNNINKFNGKIETRPMTKSEMYDLFFRTNGEKSFYSCCGKLFKKELLNGITFVESRINEDILFSYEIIKRGQRFAYIDNVLYYYFDNPDSVTNKIFKKEKLDLLVVWNDILKDIEKNNVEYIDKCNINVMRSHFTLLAKMYIDGYDKQDIELVNVKKILKKYVRKYYFELLKINMPFNRKVLLTLLII